MLSPTNCGQSEGVLFAANLVFLQFLEPSRLNGLGEILDLIQDRKRGTFKDLLDLANILQAGQCVAGRARRSRDNPAEGFQQALLEMLAR